MGSIPSFKENLAVDVRGKGIVRSVGARAEAQLFETGANIFDSAAKYINKAADERAKQEGAEAGSAAGRDENFDVTALRNDNTIYGRSYRASALESYSVGVSSDLSKNLADIEARNIDNPDGYLTEANALHDGVIEGVPSELAQPLSEMTRATIDSKYSQLRVERAKADTKIAKDQFNLHIGELKETISSKLASGDNDGFIIASAQLKSFVDNTTFIPDEVKPAYLQNVQNEVQDNAVIVIAANSGDPTAVLELSGNLNAANVQSAFALKATMENSRIAGESRRKKALEQEASNIQNELYISAVDGDLDPNLLNKTRKELINKYGMSIGEVESFTDSINDVISGKEIVSNVGVVEELEDKIRNVDTDLEAFYDRKKHTLSPDDRDAYSDRISVLRSKVMQDPRVKSSLDRYVNSVFTDIPEKDYSDSDRETIVKSNRENALKRSSAANMIRSKLEDGVISIEEVPVELNNWINQLGGDKNVVRSKVEQLPISIQTRVRTLVNAGVSIQRFEVNEKGIRVRGAEFKVDSIDHDNYEMVLREMRKKNSQTTLGRTLPFDKDVINSIEDIFSGGVNR